MRPSPSERAHLTYAKRTGEAVAMLVDCAVTECEGAQFGRGWRQERRTVGKLWDVSGADMGGFGAS